MPGDRKWPAMSDMIGCAVRQIDKNVRCSFPLEVFSDFETTKSFS
jgi:hypothetical protein